MKQYNTEDVEALIEGLEALRPALLPMKVTDALARLKPKPEKVYVLESVRPAWYYNFIYRAMEGQVYPKLSKFLDNSWSELRELTAVEATTAPVQQWNMPTWNNLELNSKEQLVCNVPAGLFCFAKCEFDGIRDKIMSMNEVK